MLQPAISQFSEDAEAFVKSALHKVRDFSITSSDIGKSFYIISRSENDDRVFVDYGKLERIIPKISYLDEYSSENNRLSYYYFRTEISVSSEKIQVVYREQNIFQTIQDVKIYCSTCDLIPYYGYSVCKI